MMNFTDNIISPTNLTREWTNSDPIQMDIKYLVKYLLAIVAAVCITVTYFVVFDRVESCLLNCCGKEKKRDDNTLDSTLDKKRRSSQLMSV